VGQSCSVRILMSYLLKLPKCNFMPDPEDTSSGVTVDDGILSNPLTCVDAVCLCYVVLLVRSAWETHFYPFSVERRYSSAFYIRKYDPETSRPS
jgi:hypothetical protein